MTPTCGDGARFWTLPHYRPGAAVLASRRGITAAPMGEPATPQPGPVADMNSEDAPVVAAGAPSGRAAKAARSPLADWKLMVAVVLGGVAIAVGVVLGSPGSAQKKGRMVDGVRIFTAKELAEFDGEKGRATYLAILGDVFDVSTGLKYYAQGKSYAHFVGKDGTRSFATGETSGPSLCDVLTGLDDQQLASIGSWHGFYKKHETYRYIGRVIGRYYDERGRVKEQFPWARLEEAAKQEERLKKELPGCNSKWTQADGSVVWCTKKSGGVIRPWVGVPRRMTPPDGRDPRCACVPKHRADAPEFAVYEGCDPGAVRCQVIR